MTEPNRSSSSASPGPERKAKRRRSLRKRLLLALACVLVVAGVLAAMLPTILSSDFAKGRIVATVQDRLTAPLDIEALRFTWAGSQEVRNLRLGAPDGFPAEETAIEIPRATVTSGLWGIVFGDGEIAIEVERPKVRIRRRADSAVNLKEIVRPTEPSEPEPGAPPAPREGEEGSTSGPAFDRRVRLTLKEAEVHFVDEVEKSQGKVELREGTFTADEGRVTAELDGVAAAALAPYLARYADQLPKGLELPGETKLGVRRLKTALELHGRRLLMERLDGRLELECDLRYAGFAVDRLDGNVRLEGGKVTLADAAASVNHGRVRASGELDLGASKRYQVQLDVEEVEANYDLSPLVCYAVPFLHLEGPEAELKGAISAALTIEGAGFSRQELEESLSGAGRLRLRDGAFTGSRFFGEIAGLVGTEVSEVLVHELGSDFEIAAGKIDVGKLFLQSKAGSKVRNLGLKGTTWFDGRLDYAVDLAELQETIGDKKVRRILEDASRILGDSVAPVKLSGTLREPKLELGAGLPGLKLPGGDKALEPGAAIQGVLDLFRKKRN